MTSMGKRGSQRLGHRAAIAAMCPSATRRNTASTWCEVLLNCADSLP
jgi:hypothetical protein